MPEPLPRSALYLGPATLISWTDGRFNVNVLRGHVLLRLKSEQVFGHERRDGTEGHLFSLKYDTVEIPRLYTEERAIPQWLKDVRDGEAA